MSHFEAHGPLAPDHALKGGTVGTLEHEFVEAKANIAQQPWVVFGCFAGAPGGEPSLEGQDGVKT